MRIHRVGVLVRLAAILWGRILCRVDDRGRRVQILRDMARRFSEQGRMHQARRALEGASRLRPGDPDLWFALASVLSQLRDFAPTGTDLEEVTRSLVIAHRSRRLLDTEGKARTLAWQRSLDELARSNIPLGRKASHEQGGVTGLASLQRGPHGHRKCFRVAARDAKSAIFNAATQGEPLVIEGVSPFKLGVRPWTMDALLQRAGNEVVKASVAFHDGYTSINQPMRKWRSWLKGLASAESASFQDMLRNPQCLIRAPIVEMMLSDLLRVGRFIRSGILQNPCNATLYSHQLDLDVYLPQLRRDVVEPAWLGENQKSRFTNLWIAATPTVVGLHYDNFENLMFALNGSKTALVFSRSARALLEFNPKLAVHVEWPAKFDASNLLLHTCDSQPQHLLSSPGARISTDTNHAQANVLGKATDGEPFPFEDDAKEQAWSCHINSGDALFIPAGVPHAVVSEPDDRLHMAVNFWFDSLTEGLTNTKKENENIRSSSRSEL